MIYLDNAATSFPKAPGLGEAIAAQVSSMGGNPGRTGGGSALAADRLLFETRESLARFFGVADSSRFAFMKNATEALNVAITGSIGPGDTVVTSSLEHNAVMRPLRWLEKSVGAKIVVVRFDGEGRPDASDLADALASRPKLAVLTMASNVTGAITPWNEIAQRFKRGGALVCLDGSQAAGHFPIALDADSADFFCFPGHKGLLGPTGMGGLCVLGDSVPEPLLRGGTGSHSASELQPEEMPDRFEAGTQNLAGAAGLLRSLAFLDVAGLRAVEKKESAMTERLAEGLRGVEGIIVHGPRARAPRVPVIAVTSSLVGIDAIERALSARGILARRGLQCAPAAHRSIGTLSGGGTIRFSPGFFTTEDEIDETIDAMARIVAGETS